ncbi:MAG: TetR/AcrR family transcriptional regulator [Rhodoferax sp.]|nr:TetR/AcrR family transcriptional regulator [Rhodoferax sp.]
MVPPSPSATDHPAGSSPYEATGHGRRERRKEARPGELLDAALELFVQKGYAATRAEEVAHLAGVSKGTLFLYFSTKEELFKAVVRENLSGRFEEWNAEFERFEGSTADMLRYGMRSWWERIGSTRASGITKLMMSEARNFPELAEFFQHEVIRPGHELIRRILQRGVDRGEFTVPHIGYATYGVLAPMMYLALWQHSLGCCAGAAELVPQDYIAAQSELLLAGLGARAPAPPASTVHP